MNDLFPETKQAKQAPRVLMHVSDAGYAESTHIVVFKCGRCGAETEWLAVASVSEAKRGIPCQACNAPKA